MFTTKSQTSQSLINNMKCEPFKPPPQQLVLPSGVKVGVLLIHGLTGMPNEMKPIAKQLERIGCEVSVPMLPGHGGSHKELLATGWKDWLAGTKEALDKLSETCDKLVVGGLSMGGLFSVLLALKNPKVCGVIALSPTIDYDGQNSNPYRVLLPLIDLAPFLGNIFYWTEGPPYGLKDQRLQRIITKQLEACKRGDKTDFGQFRTYSGSLRQLQHLVKHVKREAPKLRCPTLIIHSLEDTLTTGRNAKTLYSWLGCADKKIIWMDGCDHVLTLDLKKAEVAYHVAAFTCCVVSQSILGNSIPKRDNGGMS